MPLARAQGISKGDCLFRLGQPAGTLFIIGFSPCDLQVAREARPEVGLRMLTNLAQVIARRLQVIHAMRTRELQRAVNITFG